MDQYTPSKYSRVRRVAKRGHYDKETVYAILDAGYLGHVAFVQDGRPFNIPMLYGREGDIIYLHASVKSRIYKQLATGIPVCFSLTHVDGLVLARSVFHHSANYRSVVIHGSCQAVESLEEKNVALEKFTEHMLPGRWEEARQPSQKELQVTGVLALTIEEASAKIRTGDPGDDAEDYALPIWAGVIPAQTVYGSAIVDPLLTHDLPIPASVLNKQNGERA